MRGLPWVKEGAKTVVCPTCSAKKNRSCLHVKGISKGSPTKDSHPERKKFFLAQEVESHRMLSDLPIEEIKKDLKIKSHDNGLLGKIIFINQSNNSCFLVKWENGSESKIFHKTTANILEW